MDIVIIGQDEGVHVKDMLNSLKRFDEHARRIWVLDRCLDDSENILKELGEFYVKTSTKLKGRQTSYCRNLGLSHVREGSDVLFLDGDRYIVESESSLNSLDKDIVLLTLEIDHRHSIHDYNKAYGHVHNGFYSCGLFIKNKAIESIKQFQKGFLFDESIQQDWGIEDIYLGDVCYHLNLTCVIHPDIRLRGFFTKNTVPSINTIRTRFKLRDKLNVKW